MSKTRRKLRSNRVEATYLDSWLAENYPIEDEDTCRFAALTVDPLVCVIMPMATGCSTEEAEAACLRRWPKGTIRFLDGDGDCPDQDCPHYE